MSSDIGAVSTIRAPDGQWLSKAIGTSEPAKRHTGLDAMKSRPRMVIRSGAPGPAPMKCTVIRRPLPQFSFANTPLHDRPGRNPAAHAAERRGVRQLYTQQVAAAPGL